MLLQVDFTKTTNQQYAELLEIAIALAVLITFFIIAANVNRLMREAKLIREILSRDTGIDPLKEMEHKKEAEKQKRKEEIKEQGF